MPLTISSTYDVITFGKHGGDTVEDIIENDPQYFLWMWENDVIGCHSPVLAKQLDAVASRCRRRSIRREYTRARNRGITGRRPAASWDDELDELEIIQDNWEYIY